MSQCRVANYFEERGFGFIAPDDGSAQLFVHVSHIANADLLKKDQSVSFEFATDTRSGKPRADRVYVINNAEKQSVPFSDGSRFSDGSGFK